jgi:hydrogenase expression/formation protein HypE
MRGATAVREERVTLAHGSGGKAMADLVADVFLGAFGQAEAGALEDQARIGLDGLARHGDRLAFTTDSFVVDPLFFPGGDIGRLAVNGTVNDLAVGGARPLHLSCAVIVEEGLPVADLRRVAESLRAAAEEANVSIVTGDTKVVPRGTADRLFINTTGVGVIPRGIEIGAARAAPGDCILVNGPIGNHGVAILAAREELALDVPVESDSRPLHGLVAALLAACPETRSLRDATRGGLGAVLNELAMASGTCMELEEARIPVHEAVRGVSEILGLDPLYHANEGRLAAIVPGDRAEAALAALRSHPAGAEAAIIGTVGTREPGRVVMRTSFGGDRIVEMPLGEQLPRIC